MLAVIKLFFTFWCVARIESTTRNGQIRPYLFDQNGLRLHSPNKNDKTDFGPKIIGGWNAHEDSTKYQVSIRLRMAERIFGNGHICGGSLITYRTVLTAAHCLFYFDDENKQGLLRRPEDFVLVMGTINRFIRTPFTLSYPITRFEYHKNFNTEDMRNDIALMFLKGEVPPGFPTVQPITIATYQTPADSICQINGWGTTYFQGSASNVLLTANVTLFSTKACRRAYSQTFLSGMMCAGDWNGTHDACQGDSGGPLVCQSVLAGVVSWGNRCGSPDWPGIYTNVYYYRDWIETNYANPLSATHFLTVLSFLILSILSTVS